MGQFVEDMPGHVRVQPDTGRPISVFDMQAAPAPVADEVPAQPVKPEPPAPQPAKPAADPEGSKK